MVIKPELAGYTAASPLTTDPSLVEVLIDFLCDRGFVDVAVVGAADTSALWADNRDLHALSDLLGYQFVTPQKRTYDIVDLADAVDETVFPLGSALHGTGISRTWIDADIRIVFAKNRTDEEAGYALGLDTLIGVLPLADKTLHYRRRRHRWRRSDCAACRGTGRFRPDRCDRQHAWCGWPTITRPDQVRIR